MDDTNEYAHSTIELQCQSQNIITSVQVAQHPYQAQLHDQQPEPANEKKFKSHVYKSDIHYQSDIFIKNSLFCWVSCFSFPAQHSTGTLINRNKFENQRLQLTTQC